MKDTLGASKEVKLKWKSLFLLEWTLTGVQLSNAAGWRSRVHVLQGVLGTRQYWYDK